jgi:pyruvate/2-oxoglutarate dehydrogenase complex dihydrolipoamide dehydrogenase (E3) component
VSRLNTTYKENWEKAGITLVMGTAEFKSAKTVLVTLTGSRTRASLPLTAS